MLRERSPSPPMIRSKRQTPSPRLALSTRYSPDEMNNSPNFEEKKKFLTIFSLTHVSAEKRKGEAWPWPLEQSSPGWLSEGLEKLLGPWKHSRPGALHPLWLPGKLPPASVDLPWHRLAFRLLSI